MSLEDFTEAYIKCALWCGVLDCREESDPDAPDPMVYGAGDSGSSGMVTVSEEDLSPECRKRMEKDCASFYEANCQHFHACKARDVDARAGNDFWLTRNRHGAGYLDGHWEPSIASRLASQAHRYGECHLLLCEDGSISMYGH